MHELTSSTDIQSQPIHGQPSMETQWKICCWENMPTNLLWSKVKVLVKNCCLGSQLVPQLSAYCEQTLRKLFCCNRREKKIYKKYALVICLTNKQWEISHVGFLEYLLNKSHQRLRVHRALVPNVNVPKTPWKHIKKQEIHHLPFFTQLHHRYYSCFGKWTENFTRNSLSMLALSIHF